MPTIEKNRIEFIDLAKGVCILLVVIVHVIPEFGERFEFLNCLRMPLYFCLSGLFYKDYGGFKNFTIKKINNILIPFVAWYLIGYTIYYLGRAYMPSGNEATFHFNDILFQNEIFNLPIWFLLCLFWSNLLFSLVCRITRTWYLQLCGVMIIAGLGMVMSQYGIFNFLYIGSSMSCLPFFYMGYALKKTTILYPGSSKKQDFWIMSICLLIALMIALIPDKVPRLNYYRNEVMAGNYLSIYICASLFVVGVLLFCKFVKNIPFVSWLGRYSIIVLVTHMWLKDIFTTLVKKMSGDALKSHSIELIVLTLVLASMLAVIPLAKKYLPHITAQKSIFPIKKNRHKNLYEIPSA